MTLQGSSDEQVPAIRRSRLAVCRPAVTTGQPDKASVCAGKEVVLQYASSLRSGRRFATDANGREMLVLHHTLLCGALHHHWRIELCSLVNLPFNASRGVAAACKQEDATSMTVALLH